MSIYTQLYSQSVGGGGQGGSFSDDVPLVEFMYFVFICMPGELLQAAQVFVAAFVWCLLSAN